MRIFVLLIMFCICSCRDIYYDDATILPDKAYGAKPILLGDTGNSLLATIRRDTLKNRDLMQHGSTTLMLKYFEISVYEFWGIFVSNKLDDKKSYYLKVKGVKSAKLIDSFNFELNSTIGYAGFTASGTDSIKATYFRFENLTRKGDLGTFLKAYLNYYSVVNNFTGKSSSKRLYMQCPDYERDFIIGWELDTIFNPKCLVK